MNDTTRDELIERIAELADKFACGAAGAPVVYALHGPTDFAEEVIELVTAARDAEIREALLDITGDAVRLAGEASKGVYDRHPRAGWDVIVNHGFFVALDHIGLGEGTGGQE